MNGQRRLWECFKKASETNGNSAPMGEGDRGCDLNVQVVRLIIIIVTLIMIKMIMV